ncbi:MAG: Transketolase, C-terminal section [Firmicutes bacterium]|nr:Transketolase, C-terminal section [Bacillota bacterium]MDI6705237.1 transketolase family protein [Bacillota bacterium]
MSDGIATRDAYGKTLVSLGGENDKIVVLDADLSKSTKTVLFAEAFPERFFNMGIAEQNLIGMAAGLAASGKIPFASTFAMFASGRAFEPIRNSVAYPRLNVKIAATHAGLTVGEDGASHQCIEDIALMRAVPNMTVICPADGVETEAAVRAAAEYKGPVYIRLGRSKVPAVFDKESYAFEWGKGITVREGKDAAIIATGIMVPVAVDAAAELAECGINVRVIDIHTIKPIDRELIIRAARETGAIVTAEEHSIIGGLGSAVAEVLCESIPVPMKRIGVRDTFGESGTAEDLLEKYGLTAKNIVEEVKRLFGNKTGKK